MIEHNGPRTSEVPDLNLCIIIGNLGGATNGSGAGCPRVIGPEQTQCVRVKRGWSMYLSFHLIASIAFCQDIFFENNEQPSPQPISYEKAGTQFNNISAV